MKLQELLSYVRRAVDDFNMINEGDSIAVGVSGGKDSLSLLYALHELRRFYPKKFDVCGITVSLGFDGCNFNPIEDFCSKLGIPYFIVNTNIGQILFDDRNEKNPCSLCSKMRKGALHDEAIKRGYNKIALGHHLDDTIETFFLSLFYEGRINTFSPVTFLDRMQLFSIRPLLYVHEREIINFVNKYNIPVVSNPCKANGYTKRTDIKNMIKQFNTMYDNFDQKIFGAICRSKIKGWEKVSDNGNQGS